MLIMFLKGRFKQLRIKWLYNVYTELKAPVIMSVEENNKHDKNQLTFHTRQSNTDYVQNGSKMSSTVES